MTKSPRMLGFSAAVILANGLGAFSATPPGVPEIRLYGNALTKFVRDDGRVDYAGLKATGALNEFVKQLASVSPDSHPALFPTRDARLAYWINAYNALVLHSFSREYPEKRTRLTSMVGRALFFYKVRHVVGGKRRSLADIEDHSIRNMGDPRIHFAIVCASAGCPALSRKPYTAGTLDAHLDAEARKYLAEGRNLQIDDARKTVRLAQIFEWFRADFGTTPEKVLEFISQYRPIDAQKLQTKKWKIAYFPYDWSANDVRL
jgi:hypothetical protein